MVTDFLIGVAVKYISSSVSTRFPFGAGVEIGVGIMIILFII